MKIRRTKEVHRSVTDPVESKSSQFSRRKRHRVGLFSTGFFFRSCVSPIKIKRGTVAVLTSLSCSMKPLKTFALLLIIILCDLATGRERQLTTGKRAERTKHDFRSPICRSAIGQASCLICARRRLMTFLFCC